MKRILAVVLCCMGVASQGLWCGERYQETTENKLLTNKPVRILFACYNRHSEQTGLKISNVIEIAKKKISPKFRKILDKMALDLISSMQSGVKTALDPFFEAWKEIVKKQGNPQVSQNCNTACLLLAKAMFKRITIIGKEVFKTMDEDAKSKAQMKAIIDDSCNIIFDGLIDLLKDPEARIAVKALVAEEAK